MQIIEPMKHVGKHIIKMLKAVMCMCARTDDLKQAASLPVVKRKMREQWEAVQNSPEKENEPEEKIWKQIIELINNSLNQKRET